MPADRPQHLSPAQLRLLARLAADSEQPAVARRARIVLAEHHRRAGSPAAQADAPAVSRQTAAKWLARFTDAGVAGLHDRPRTGRPPVHGDDSALSILVAPLLAPSVRWTSHTLAQLTGQSQSAVVRAWRRAFETDAVQPPGPLPSGGLALVAALVDAGNSLLVLASREAAVPLGSATPFMRSPRRPPLQALLAADLLAGSRPAAAGAASDPGSLVETARRRLGSSTTLYVLWRRPPDAPPPPLANVHHLYLQLGQQWQGLLEPLVRRCTATPQPRLLALQQRLMAWAQEDRAPFEWLDEDVVRQGRSPSSTGGEPRALGQVVADAVLASVLERIVAGRLAAGDRITESSLSRAVHASRGHVREALLLLASSGLVELEPHRGALVPAPQTADVVETYAVRRALGALVVRRAAQAGPSALAPSAPAQRALAELVRVGATGDAWAAGEADIRFQDALATGTGMRRIPPMFLALSSQIRLFTAVMGVRYAYSIPQMIHDDTMLLQHITERDEAAASRAWHAKMDDALGYMLTQLGSPGAPARR